MELYEITADLKVSPGEYILHQPSNFLVLCGAFKRGEDIIRVLGPKGMFEDKINNFRKIKLDKTEQKNRMGTRCKGCRSK